MKPIEIAIEAAGNAHRLAKGINVPAQSVIFWRDGARQIPAEYCPRIEALTGVRCEALRPDVRWDVIANRQTELAPAQAQQAQPATQPVAQGV